MLNMSVKYFLKNVMHNCQNQIKNLALSSILILSLHSCGSRHASEAVVASPGCSIETAQDKAIRMWQAKEPFDKCIAQQMIAVNELRAGKPQNDPVEILATAGEMHMRHGDYFEAMTYYQEASDSINDRSDRGEQPKEGDIRLHGNLAAIYTRFDLHDDALREYDLAMEASRKNGYMYASDLYRKRSLTFMSMLNSRPQNRKAIADSILHSLDMAVKVIPRMPVNGDSRIYARRSASTRAHFFVLHRELFPDSLDRAIRTLEDLIRDASPEDNTYGDIVVLGQAMVYQGKYAEGIALVEDALKRSRARNDAEMVDYVLGVLADCYAGAGEADKLLEIYPHVTALNDSMSNQELANAVIGADFRYRLKEARQAEQTMAAEKESARKLAIYEGMALVIGLLAGALATWFGVRRLRKAKAEKEHQQHTIDDILTRQQILNATIEELHEKLSQRDNNDLVEKVTESLTPTLLCGEDEDQFRRAFARLHPAFLKSLRHDFPTLTPNDELVLMLIYLKVPPVDISLCMGISRASLNSIRYRIRKKMNLDKDTDLDTFICSR